MKPLIAILLGEICKYTKPDPELAVRNEAFGWTLQIEGTLVFIAHLLVRILSAEINKRLQKEFTSNPSRVRFEGFAEIHNMRNSSR